MKSLSLAVSAVAILTWLASGPVAACSEVIESNAYTGTDLAFAYNNRAVAHYQQKDFDAAVTDFGNVTPCP